MISYRALIIIIALAILFASSGCSSAGANDDPVIRLNSRIAASEKKIVIYDRLGDAFIKIERNSFNEHIIDHSQWLAEEDTIGLALDAYADGMFDLFAITVLHREILEYSNGN